MPPIKLKGSPYKTTAKGRTYIYAWRGPDAPRINAPEGSPAFIQELSDALAARSGGGDQSRISALVAQYRASDEYNGLAQSTKDLWLPWLDRIRDHFGPLAIRLFDRPAIRVDIRRWHHSRKNTPRAADTGLQVLSRVLSFGVAEGKLARNACDGVPHLHKSNRADVIWASEDMEKLLAVASEEVSYAARLAALTGLRRGDLLKLSWSHIGAAAIEIKTGKSRGRRSATVPVFDDLRDLLDKIPKRATTVLTSSDKRPWTGDGFGSSWWKAIQDAGLRERGLRFHDFRGTAATNFYRANFTVREIAETLGWSEDRIERLIDRYVKRDEILKDRARRMNAARQVQSK